MENNQVVLFQVGEARFPLTIHDAQGKRWVPSRDVGEALGHSSIRNLIADLWAAGELVEGKHFRKVTLRNSDPTRGNPNIVVLSSRGIIRIAMRAQTPRAIAFRDWAEDVLIEVMETGRFAPDTDPGFARRLSSLLSSFHAGLSLGLSKAAARVYAAEIATKETGFDFLSAMPRRAEGLVGSNGKCSSQWMPHLMEFIDDWEKGKVGISYHQVQTACLYQEYLRWCAERGCPNCGNAAWFSRSIGPRFGRIHLRQGNFIIPNPPETIAGESEVRQ